MGPPTSYAPTSRLRGGRIGSRGGTSFRGGARGVGIRGRAATFKTFPMSESGRLAELAASKRHNKKLSSSSAGGGYKLGSPDPERKRKIDKLRRYDMNQKQNKQRTKYHNIYMVGQHRLKDSKNKFIYVICIFHQNDQNTRIEYCFSSMTCI